MRTMYDSVTAGNIPTSAQLVAGYVSPSGYAWSAANWARFPNSVLVRITPQVSHTGVGIQVLDVETGDATPAQAPGWVKAQRALGQDPTVYCSQSVWQTVQNEFNAQGVAQPHYWIAAYPGGGSTVLPSLNGIVAVAHQYADAGPYDLSVVADYWPGVDDPMAALQSDDYTNIAVAVWEALLVKGNQSAQAQVWLVNADTNASSEVAADLDPKVNAVLSAVTAVEQSTNGNTVTLTPDQLTALETSVQNALGQGYTVTIAPKAA